VAAWANISFWGLGCRRQRTWKRKLIVQGSAVSNRGSEWWEPRKVDGGSRGMQQHGTASHPLPLRWLAASSPVSLLSTRPERFKRPESGTVAVKNRRYCQLSVAGAPAYNGRLEDTRPSPESRGLGSLQLWGRVVPTASLIDGPGDRSHLLKRHLNFGKQAHRMDGYSLEGTNFAVCAGLSIKSSGGQWLLSTHLD
jgi:hypothetical protein